MGTDIAAAIEELIERARTEPLEVDVSDYGDEWVDGFLRGQVNALQEVGPSIAAAIREDDNGAPADAASEEVVIGKIIRCARGVVTTAHPERIYDAVVREWWDALRVALTHYDALDVEEFWE